jgi:hypothetical protein
MFSLINLAGVSSSGRPHRQTSLGASCLEIAGSDGIRWCAPMFFLTIWFYMERYKALLLVAIMGLLWSMVMSEEDLSIHHCPIIY